MKIMNKSKLLHLLKRLRNGANNKENNRDSANLQSHSVNNSSRDTRARRRFEKKVV